MTTSPFSQSGRIALVTGGTSGLGFCTAAALAGAGATVILAGRDPGKGEAAVSRILAAHPGAAVRFSHIDQSSLADVARFASEVRDAHPRLDILVNNAGVLAPPVRQVTGEGFELQFVVNYLSHFALTADLLPLLRQAGAPRVVSVSSIAHKFGRIALDDFQGARHYDPWRSYGQSKLAMLLFAQALHRRSQAAGWGVTSVAAHPGWARTSLFATGPRLGGRRRLEEALIGLAQPFFSQSARDGAEAIIMAATDPAVRGGAYLGPQGLFETRGPVGPARLSTATRSADLARALWDASERLSGRRFA